MDKHEHRRLRLLELLDNPPFAGRGGQTKLSKASGIDASYISRLLYVEGKPGKKRLAEDTIEAFERGSGLPKGWFDLPLGTSLLEAEWIAAENAQDHADALQAAMHAAADGPDFGNSTAHPRPIGNSTTPPRPIAPFNNADELEGEYVHLPAIKLKLSAGNGSVAWEVDNGKPRAFDKSFIEREGIDPSCAATMVVSGDSMDPTLRDGWSVLVDYCQQPILDGKVYALVWQGEYFIKRLYKESGGALRISSDNKKYPDRTISAEHMDEVCIIGRVDHIVGGRL